MGRGWGAGRTGQELSLTEFQKKRDAKYPNTPGAGHMWANAKYYSYNDARSRSGTDAAVKQRNDESRAGLFSWREEEGGAGGWRRWRRPFRFPQALKCCRFSASALLPREIVEQPGTTEYIP